LNEARGLRAFLEHCQETLARDKSTHWTILVADNGSTDGSREVVRALGVELLEVPQRGYGAALNAGISHASTTWVIYADADGTYSPQDAIRLLAAARENGGDLVVGDRLNGTIHPGAMPWSHRYLGTPVLSFLLRRLFSVPISDCNSGIRCVRREAYQRWKIRSRGMEFASALLIKAALAGAKISEVPVELKRGATHRVPHLRTWTDGMRHLLVILAASPNFFWRLGALLLVLSLALAVPCIHGPRIIFGGIGFFGEHTLVMALLIGFYGALSANLALLLHSRSGFRSMPRTLRFLLEMREGVLFWWLVTTLAVTMGGFFYIFLQWKNAQYRDIDYVKMILFFLYLSIVHTSLLFGIFQAHLGRNRGT